MANTLTNLIPTLYKALDIVSREIVGFIPAISINAAPTDAAKGQTIRIPVTPTATTHDIVPGAQPADNGDQVISEVDMLISKSKYSPVRWNGEEQLGVSHSGTYNTILAQQFAQSMRALVNEAEADIGSVYIAASRAYGTAGTAPFASNISETAQLRKILVDNGAPTTDLQLVIDTSAGANLRSLMNLTRVNEAGTDETLRRGALLSLNGFAIGESAGVNQHTAGSLTGTPLVNKTGGYLVGDVSIAYDGVTASALKAGDIVKFGSTDPNKYVVSADASATPLKINAPGLIADVDNDAGISVGNAYAASLAFDRSAIQAIFRVPAVPDGGDSADDRMVITDPVSGISFDVSVYRQYKQVKYEVGLAWGWKCIKPAHVAILLG